MNPERIPAAAHQAIDALGTGAHTAIAAYRAGGERLGYLASQRWNASFRQASPKLSAETRRNATHARKVFGGYYARGLQLSADGAEAVVDTLTQAAGMGVDRTAEGIERAAAFVRARAGKPA